MLFNSYEFIFAFLPITFFVYFYLSHKKLATASKGWLFFASLFFYSWWNIIYLPLILTSILFNYTISNIMVDCDEVKKKYLSKKILLQIGLVFNIGLLAYFKYMDFFIYNINGLVGTDIELLHLALPLAISFFTLQQIAFLMDCYEGLAKEKNFLNYAVFVSFFPQLIAGPIVHHKEMIPQFESIKNKVKNYKNIALGLFIFSIGLFKKVVIADTFAISATQGFDLATSLSFFEAWGTALSYTFQLYFDFSGYTDMAIGAALLFNIRLPQNFNSPYKATGIIDFWQRWHMTLTGFINTYLYSSMLLSFKKITFKKSMIITFITFVIVGLWHGASWMFVIFGSLHGIALIINHSWRKTKVKLNKALAWFITFNFFNLTLVIFRAKNWDDATKIFGSMFDISSLYISSNFSKVVKDFFYIDIDFLINKNYIFNFDLSILLSFLVAFIIISFKNTTQLRDQFVLNAKNLLLTCIYLLVSFYYILYMQNRVSAFLYFDF